MRQVISRLLKHLEAEKNASATSLETCPYNLHKFAAYLAKRLGNRFFREISPKTTYEIISGGSQKKVEALAFCR